ncbi:hypothetical protein T492DRAFT_934119 [Pavlovales sp. CCMP2436]|nr:hypothetical protein T492DRAFT_934119 [Pavlovales sp. CCMP2436]
MSAVPRQLRSPPLQGAWARVGCQLIRCDHLRPTRRAHLAPPRLRTRNAGSARASLLYPPPTPCASLVVRAS